MRQYIIILVFICSGPFVLCDRGQCVTCGESKKCAQNPQGLSPKDCKEGSEWKTCIVYIDKKGRTNRGCGTGKAEVDFKNALNQNLTHSCPITEKTCNNKIFPENRLKCVTSSENSQVTLPCVLYNDDKEECFSVKLNNVVTKGCVSDGDDDGDGDGDINENVCTKNPTACKRCTGKDECNKDDKAKCYQCTGDADCKRTTSDCKTINPDKVKECKSSEGCFTLQQRNEVTRGCMSDVVGKPDGLTVCNDQDACNGACLADITKCFNCDSKANPDCIKETMDEKLSDTCPPYTRVCYFCEDQDGIYHRGCGQPKNSTYSCNFCREDNCKPTKPESSCLKCDSSKDGLKCVLGEGFTMSTPCSNAKDACVVLIKDGNTIRGCAKEILGEKGECTAGTCSKCNKHNCNGGIFPANRRRCFQCAKGANCRDEPQGADSKPCLNYDPNEDCYMYMSDNEMYRGCKSDADKNSKGCDTAAKTPCVECHKDNCNRFPAERPSSLKCMKCKKNAADCVWGQGDERSVQCQGKVQLKYYEVEKCYTAITRDANKTEVQRGCGIDEDACKESGPGCVKCETDMCNRENFMEFTCIRCRSDNPRQENCANAGDAIAIAPSNCTNSNIQQSEKGCYTRNYHGATVRGCFADLDVQMREWCKANGTLSCNYCADVNCNNQLPPNSSNINSLSFLILIIAFMAVCFLQ